MAYTVLARRYRSQSFDDVVGQEPIAKTLKSAIAAGRVAHAYLFTGTRGVGKTSMARIFARALNAPDTVADAPKSPEVEAYPDKDVQQRMAEAIMRGDDLNVIEIDGASNNSVEQARQLIANAGLSPTGNAHYKVYIIDEVHMLSGAAFNALLKTMEEPPSHVKFILCTTEPHKVPATIQSRCQKFDFRNIPAAKIAEHLAAVLKREQIDAEDEVIWQVARLGNGSMRDALSLLDRLLARPGDETLTVKVLEQVLGLPDQQLVASLVDALAAGDIKASLDRTAELLGRGIGQDQLTGVLIERLRQLMLIQACGQESELIELSAEATQEAVQQARQFDAAGLVYMIALLENLQRSAKNSSHPRALLDVTIVRLALAEKMADVTALLAGDTGSKKKVTPDTRPSFSRDAPRHAAPPKRPPAAQDTSARHIAQPPAAGAANANAPTTDRPTTPTTTATTPTPTTTGPTIPRVDAADTRAVWSALIDQLADRPAWGWVEKLRLASIDSGRAVLEPLPGQREILGFLSDARQKQLAEHLTGIIGSPVRVTVQTPGGDTGDADTEQGGEPDARTTAAVDRRAAMDLPLMKEVMEHFPDAVLVDVREESSEQP